MAGKGSEWEKIKWQSEKLCNIERQKVSDQPKECEKEESSGPRGGKDGHGREPPGRRGKSWEMQARIKGKAGNVDGVTYAKKTNLLERAFTAGGKERGNFERKKEKGKGTETLKKWQDFWAQAGLRVKRGTPVKAGEKDPKVTESSKVGGH